MRTSVDKARIIQLHLQHLDAATIAERLGCSRRAVHLAIQQWSAAQTAEQAS
ncbi:biotin operon repressor [Endobacter medicaginis]|uniref:Biotin operon repressor n=1 Tax=Endobacter medicaginis TaxID=1181271 RepID=A0A850NSB6_9PROT|nr:helix-turn-helix domain-containing protein [Endobacter medicaginis]MBB3175450.1 biotin operon repressor [Endobacter medicaginis]MCX5477115.1 helix-turn-helix domain-containing protein [Endobacter medicaginis]NVN29828.1 helix-turn-helix domain-containing protein [Endobacter medicaginis]